MERRLPSREDDKLKHIGPQTSIRLSLKDLSDLGNLLPEKDFHGRRRRVLRISSHPASSSIESMT